MERMKALESRADIESLEELQQARRELVESGARLAAMFGSWGIFDDVRKQRLELAKVAARSRLKENGETVTDKSVEAAAYADPGYRKVLDDAERDRISWIKWDNKITEINERIRNRELSLRAYTVEAGLR
jgi:hypothetical protein